MKQYNYAGEVRVGMRTDVGTGRMELNWLMGDHLGSTSITATSTGAKGAEVRYKAWGENRYTSGTTPTTFRFTGQRQESGIGLYFYNARWYDPVLGRFTQADTIVPQPGNVLAWDRYAYVNNNPVRYTDPSGHAADQGGGGAPMEVDWWMRRAEKLRMEKKEAQLDPRLGRPSSIGPSIGSSNTSTWFSSRQPENNITKNIEGIADFYEGASTIEDGINWVINYGRPAYKQVKGVIPGGIFLEGALGISTQAISDLKNPNFLLGQRISRALIVGVEDATTDAVATAVGSQTARFGMLLGAGATVETGPGMTFGGSIGGFLGFVGGSYASTQIIDNIFWKNFNSAVFPSNFPD